MDQHLAVGASTRKVTEDNSSNLHSAVSSPTDTTATHGSGYFDFLALPRELRDMIYDQFHRLHPDTPMFREAGQPELMLSLSVRTKLVISLLLVNKKIGSEYSTSCENRFGVIVSSPMEDLAPGVELEAEISSSDAEIASFIHMHAGDWMNRRWLNDPEWTLSPLKAWLAHWDSQMPSLDSIAVTIYLNIERLDLSVEGKKLVDTLQDFVSVPKLRELRVVTMDNALQWNRSERGPNPRKLLVHWTPSDSREPTLIDSSQPYAETCCELLDPLDNDSDDSSSDSDQGYNNHHEYGNDGNESDDDGDESENNYENDDAGNSPHGEADNGDDEKAENADQNSSEHSDGMGSGGDRSPRDSQTTQAPSYFDFFGLPPEIRDMIYDQPEMLEHETPLYHFEGVYYSSLPMGATKPRTQLLLVNRRFGSEYTARCEGRSGLVISDRMAHFVDGGWEGEVGIPPTAAENASFMHIHVGAFMSLVVYYSSCTNVLESWLAHWVPQMPKLKTITGNFYTCWENFEDPHDRDLYMRHLEGFVQRFDGVLAVKELTELKVIVMKDAEQWRSKDEEKYLVVQWERRSASPPKLVYPPLKYEGECCDGSFVNDTEVYDRLPHNLKP